MYPKKALDCSLLGHQGQTIEFNVIALEHIAKQFDLEN